MYQPIVQAFSRVLKNGGRNAVVQAFRPLDLRRPEGWVAEYISEILSESAKPYNTLHTLEAAMASPTDDEQPAQAASATATAGEPPEAEHRRDR